MYVCHGVDRFTVVHRTEYIRKTLSPTWKPFTVLTRALCNGDPDRSVQFNTILGSPYIN